ncbi:MAG: hypothetical protein JNL72_14185 [Flavipsychrobacter sp.]|nr:hypothetical protein [Flavipsychrobacter sp.]
MSAEKLTRTERGKMIVNVIVLIVTCFAVSRMCNNPPDFRNDKISVNTEAPERPAIPDNLKNEDIITAQDLSVAYHNNEVVCDERVKDKVIPILGRVSSINKDFMDKPYAVVETDNMFMGMHCDISKEDAMKLRKGDIALFYGTYQVQKGAIPLLLMPTINEIKRLMQS